MTVKRDHYSNGQLMYEHPHKNGELHGVERWWYDNGQLWSEDPFQDGKRHGVTRFWNEDGKLDLIYYYLYGDEVTEEEFKKHELIEKLSGL